MGFVAPIEAEELADAVDQGGAAEVLGGGNVLAHKIAHVRVRGRLFVEPLVGLEPTTYCLQDSCSTN
jgi:hypothetical protein